MTPTERKYRTVLGKLYNIPRVRWGNEDQALVMPYDMVKHGGWWYFICYTLTQRDKVYNPDGAQWSCSEFMRKAVSISNQPPPVK